MVPVIIKYKTLGIPRQLKRHFPNDWNALTPRQLLSFTKCMLMLKNVPAAKLDGYLRMLVLWKVMKIPRRILLDMTEVQAAHLTLRLKFLFKDSHLTEQKIPKVRRWLREYYGPRSHLENLKIKEFVVSEKYYQQYIETGQPTNLDGLVTTLYRPKNPNASPDTMDNRLEINPTTFGRRLKTVQSLRPEIKLAILYYYLGCRNEMMHQYPAVFSGGQGEATEGVAHDWMDFFRNLPSDKFGNLEQIENTYVHPVLDIANRMMMDNQQRKTKSA